MKKIYPVLLMALFLSCQEKPKKNVQEAFKTAVVNAPEKNFPEALGQVFEAHGGIDHWRQQRTLQYTLSKPENTEIHTVDLKSRYDKVETSDYAMGFDGKVWLLDASENYEGNPEFYHNLMFYFYAMPFVLADDGINYGETEPLEFEGSHYPGIQITYNSGVGTSPKDEYYIHYDPETHQMAWLGYTVTYRTGEDSDNIKWIRYDDWTDVDGLLLPKSISWYTYEGREIKGLRNTVSFENVSLSLESKPEIFYAKPDNAKYYKRP